MNADFKAPVERWNRLSKKKKIIFAVIAGILVLSTNVLGIAIIVVSYLFAAIAPLSNSMIGQQLVFVGYEFAMKQFNNRNKEKEVVSNLNIMKRNDFGEKNRSAVFDAALDEMDALIGLSEIKDELKKIAALHRIEKERGRSGSGNKLSLNFVFLGPPGTGKSTVARILGDVFFGLGVLQSGHLVEVGRPDLVAGYEGQTAMKTQEILKLALDGVLFVDEAYSLAEGNSRAGFGGESVDAILKFMEDNRGRLCVIVAGYDDKMDNFIDSNPGLASRFSRKIKFNSYEADELTEIFCKISEEDGMGLPEFAKKALQEFFENMLANAPDNFGNGRFVRNLYERCREAHALRLVQVAGRKESDLNTFSVEDILSQIVVGGLKSVGGSVSPATRAA